MSTVGAENTILAIDFRQPYVMDEASGFLDAGAILATFGVGDAALMDILSGKFTPTGKLPFALANTAKAIIEQAPDAPGYAEEDTLFPFGHGLTY
jgi:beta-glucosidase